MADTERVSMAISTPHSKEEGEVFHPGLRIRARTTSASLSDYPEWTMEELYSHRRDAIVTDGACS